MSAFVELQEAEFAAADKGFTAVKHQREVGTGYFDAVTQAIQGAQSSTVPLKGSTEAAQFETRAACRHAARTGHRIPAPTTSQLSSRARSRSNSCIRPPRATRERSSLARSKCVYVGTEPVRRGITKNKQHDD